MTITIEEDDEPEPLAEPQIARALDAAIGMGMPPSSLALYGRWWQLETWLRELVYVELRSSRGRGWVDAVKETTVRQQQDAPYTHMTGVDNDNPLAYLDYSQLLNVIREHWDLFGYALFEGRSWNGRQDELKRIRHRIGHLRRPHADDLGRLEQTLRDLEQGTFVALASYNDRRQPDLDLHRDPVTDGWIREQHEDAQRLMTHAEHQYETRLIVRISRRPWAAWPEDLERAPGVLWHADYFMRGRTLDPRALWHDSSMNTVKPLLLHLLADDPGHVSFTFSAVDDPHTISDAIGRTLDAVLELSRPGMLDVEARKRWRHHVRDVDYRVISGRGWNIIDETTLPVSIFNAGAAVRARPSW